MVVYFGEIVRYVMALIFVVMPFFFAARCDRTDGMKSAFMFVLSCLVSWGYLIVARIVIGFVDVNIIGGVAAQNEFVSDGAKMGFAVYFGWIPALVMSLMAWLLMMLRDVLKTWKNNAGGGK